MSKCMWRLFCNPSLRSAPSWRHPAEYLALLYTFWNLLFTSADAGTRGASRSHVLCFDRDQNLAGEFPQWGGGSEHLQTLGDDPRVFIVRHHWSDVERLWLPRLSSSVTLMMNNLSQRQCLHFFPLGGNVDIYACLRWSVPDSSCPTLSLWPRKIVPVMLSWSGQSRGALPSSGEGCNG